MKRWIIAIVLVGHGIGHVQGILHFFGLGTDTWNERSWLLTNLLGNVPAKILGTILWSVALIGFVIAGLGVLEVGPASWRGWAAAAAIVSLVTLFLYWNGLATIFNKLSAIAVNLVVLWGAFIADWPAEDWLD